MPKTMPKHTKRKSNNYKCDGSCGKANCRFIKKGFPSKCDLQRHLGRDKHVCPVCSELLTWGSGTLYRHFRGKHQKLLNANDGCPKHNIPNKRSKLKVPDGLKEYKDPFYYLKEKIRICIISDHQRFKDLEKSIEKYQEINNQDKVRYYTNILANYADVVEKTDQNIHQFATQWLRYLVQTKRMDTFQHESGLIFAYHFQKHGGLFGISLDRKHNDYPHFDGSRNAFQNVRDVRLCLNTSCNPLMHYKDFKQSVLEQIKLPSTLDLNILMHRKSICYRSISHIWNSKRKVKNQVEHVLLKNMFGDLKNFKSYCKKVLEDQDYRCAITGIYLLNGMYDTMPDEEKVFAMSINAIDPKVGHVKGNIEWVCRFINVINAEKNKKVHHKDDPPNGWTKELFEKYFLG
ncbi:MAG: hypothetical protein CMF41_01200 [Legionellales bacterium]|nr:hypothetical protein [Legionellales bacterium]